MAFFADIRRTWNAALISAEIEDASRVFFADPKNAPFRDDIAWNRVWQQYLVLVLAKAEESGQKLRSLEAMEIARDLILHGIGDGLSIRSSPPPSPEAPEPRPEPQPQQIISAHRNAEDVFFADPANAPILKSDALYSAWKGQFKAVAFDAFSRDEKLTELEIMLAARKVLAERGLLIREQDAPDESWIQAGQQFFEDSSNQIIQLNAVLMKEWEDEMQAIVNAGDQKGRSLSDIQLMYAARQNLIDRGRIQLRR